MLLSISAAFNSLDRSSHLFIDGKQLINNGGIHGAQQVCGAINLAEGGHNVKVRFLASGCSLVNFAQNQIFLDRSGRLVPRRRRGKPESHLQASRRIYAYIYIHI